MKNTFIYSAMFLPHLWTLGLTVGKEMVPEKELLTASSVNYRHLPVGNF